jgi:hypothetical protein
LLHLTLTIRIEFHQITRIVSEPTGLARFHEFELQPHQVQTIQGRVNYPADVWSCGITSPRVTENSVPCVRPSP